MAKQIQFEPEYLYHIYNRGVRKSEIFVTESDYKRFENLLHWYLNYNYTYSKYIFRIHQARIDGKSPKEILQEIDEVKKIKNPTLRFATGGVFL